MYSQSKSAIGISVLSTLFSQNIYAQIATDGSLGAAVTLNDPNVQIGETLGTRVGNNLFHSFEIFNIASNGSATFTGSNLDNVISRVTGGQPSQIDGVLRSEVSNANLFFINPAGVMFGSGSSVDVPAAFHLSTAAELRFSDNSVFSAVTSGDSTLSIAAPEAFGFFAASNNGNIEISGSQLNLNSPESAVSLSAGSVSIVNSQIAANNIILSSIGSGDSLLTLNNNGIPTLAADGQLLLDSSFIGVSGDASQLTATGAEVRIENGTFVASNIAGSSSAEPIQISAGQLTIDGMGSTQSTGVSSDVLGGAEGDAADISINVNDALVVRNGGTITTSTAGRGDAGQININASTILVDGQNSQLTTGIVTGIASAVFPDSTGNAGTIQLTASNQLQVLNGSAITSFTFGPGNSSGVSIVASDILLDGGAEGLPSVIDSSTFGAGAAGVVTLEVDQLTIQRSGAIFSSAGPFSTGNAGQIDINASGDITIESGGQISSSTFSEGDAGIVNITADNIEADGSNGNQLTLITSTAEEGSTGDAGQVDINISGDLRIQSGGQIASATLSEGDAGIVNITANNIELDGSNSNQLTLITSTANPGANGNAGQVNIRAANDLQVLNSGQIVSLTFGAGEAGSVVISAQDIVVDGIVNGVFSSIASTSRVNATGDAGGVDILAGNSLNVLNGGNIESNAEGAGNAGSVQIQAQNIVVDGNGEIFSSAEQQSSGDAGSVIVIADGQILVINGGQIASSTFGSGNAGSVEIAAAQITLDGAGGNRATLFTSSGQEQSEGNAGIVKVTTSGDITLLNGATIFNGSLGSGSGGSIEIEADTLSIRSGSDIASNAVGNVAGPVNVQTNTLVVDNSQLLTNTDSPTADGGNISIDSNTVVLKGALIQANAISGRGGEILIQSDAVVPSLGQLSLDTPERAIFQTDGPNIIQAVAPTGISVPANINAPEIDVSGIITELDSNIDNTPAVTENPCAAIQAGSTSSLYEKGRGGLPLLPPATEITNASKVWFEEYTLEDTSQLQGADNKITLKDAHFGCSS